MPISFSQRMELECPVCHVKLPVDGWLIVDAGERPDLAARCRDGSIFTILCPNGHTGTLNAPLLYHERAREKLILALPPDIDEPSGHAIHDQLRAQLQTGLVAPFPEYLSRTQVVPQRLLATALADDPEAAFAALRAIQPKADGPVSAEQNALAETLEQFLKATTWEASQRILEEHPELLTDAADLLLAESIDTHHQAQDADTEGVLIEHRELLQDARHNGISAAFESKRRIPAETDEPGLPPEIMARLNELNVQSQQDFERAMREHPDLAEEVHRAVKARDPRIGAIQALSETRSPQAVLHTVRLHPVLLEDETIEQIHGIIADARQQNQHDMARHLEDRLQPLLELKRSGASAQDLVQFEQSARNPEMAALFQELAQEGITSPEQLEEAMQQRPELRERMEQANLRADPVAAEEIPEEVRPLLDEIGQLTSLADIPHKVELCERAVNLIQRGSNPTLWAALQGEWAIAQNNNPEGDRAGDLEDAIRHYELALQVYTQEAFPEQWAMTQHNMAIAYSDRIQGEPAENLDQAIQHYELALQVFQQQAYPDEWATAQRNLADAHQRRNQKQTGGESEASDSAQ
jgi:tetratricopeptide (TPR) repeat protein